MSFIKRFLSRVRLSTAVEEAPPVTESIARERELFPLPSNRYLVYQKLIELDPELAGAIDTKATIVDAIIAGFRLHVGKEISAQEEELLDILKTEVEPLVMSLKYDIACKLIIDGNACYYVDTNAGEGVKQLVYLPMSALTCLESPQQVQLCKDEKKQLQWWQTQIFSRGVYVLNEGTEKEQMFPASKVIHFDLGKIEEVYDLKGRYTLGVWNKSPLESLKSKVLWKHAILINDMLWRERNIPRQHHKIKVGGMFDPSRFPGDTYQEKLANARKAAQQFLQDYARTIAYAEEHKWPRPDEGYITFDNVEIDYVEPKVKFTAENELLDQIDKSIYSLICPESAVSGRSHGTYASELVISGFTALKAERLASQIAKGFIKIAKMHIMLKYGDKFTQEDLNKIDVKIRKILERHQLVRDAAILRETGLFTPNEIREVLDYDPLTREQMDELTMAHEPKHRHTETLKEIKPTIEQINPRRPIPPESKEQQQVT